MRSVPRWSRPGAGIAIALAAFALVGWQGVSTVGREGGNDAGEHLRYAIFLDDHGSLPGRRQNYEYATPPLFHAAAIGLEHAVRRAPSFPAELPSNPLTRALWIALAAGGAVCMTSRRRRARAIGLACLGLAALWGLDEAVSLGKTEPWSAGQMLALASCVGLIVVTGLIALEVWPGRPRRALGAAGFVAAYPVVLRMGVLFHPEMPLAFLSSLAMLLFLRATRRGWPPTLGWALGATCAAAALTRQTALVAILCIFAAGAVLGGRRATGFLVRAALLTVLLTAPWWVYAERTWHNPLQSNLDRPGLMLGHEPASFFVSAPVRTLVVHPYRPDFGNELLPQLHAELWSDWFGAWHGLWQAPSRLDRVTASTQSVLGFAGDALALAGLIAVALPAGLRALRRRAAAEGADLPIGFLGFLTLAALAGFLLMLLRFPQRDGDPIKSSYLLFTAPCWAIFSVAAWTGIGRRHARAAAALVSVAVLYTVSYGAELGGAFSHPSFWSGASGFGEAPGTIDLNTSIQASTSTAYPGSEVDFAVIVTNHGEQTGDNVVLTIDLPEGMELLGRPYFERGAGCQGVRTLTCKLGFLPGEKGTLVRFAVRAPILGIQTVKAAAYPAEPDLHPADNVATFGLFVGTPTTTPTTTSTDGAG